jgi:CBS domain-containing protein
MKVRELVANKPGHVVTVHPRTPVSKAIDLLIRHNIGGLPVITLKDELVGFIAERDIVEALQKNEGAVRQLPVEAVMRWPAPTCHMDDSLNDVMTRMTVGRSRHLVVLDGSRIAGIISLGDLVKQRLEQVELEAGVLRDLVAAQRAR